MIRGEKKALEEEVRFYFFYRIFGVVVRRTQWKRYWWLEGKTQVRGHHSSYRILIFTTTNAFLPKWILRAINHTWAQNSTKLLLFIVLECLLVGRRSLLIIISNAVVFSSLWQVRSHKSRGSKAIFVRYIIIVWHAEIFLRVRLSLGQSSPHGIYHDVCVYVCKCLRVWFQLIYICLPNLLDECQQIINYFVSHSLILN